MTHPSEGPRTSPAAQLLGRRVIEAADGRARVSYRAGSSLHNRIGNVQGGMIAAMLDSAMGIAGATVLGAGRYPVTLEIKVSFLRPAVEGTLVADARVIRSGGTILFTEATLSDEGGEPVATGTATARIVRRD